MFSLLVWCIYGIFVGSISKAIVPGEDRLSFLQTITLGVIGSYTGGALMYLLGQYDSVSPAGVVMGVVGGVVALIVYNKLNK